jgi:hypothetical protein
MLLAQDIQLPAPQRTGGKAIFDTLAERQTDREITDADIDRQTLSDILWAAYGFNRDDKRTIPTSRNKQDIDLYVFLKEGVYQYDAKTNKLILKTAGDNRKGAGSQPFVHIAPINLLYVLDKSKNDDVGGPIACGCAIQSVYLVCASKDLACTVRTTIEKEAAKTLCKLTEKQVPTVGQTIGKKK